MRTFVLLACLCSVAFGRGSLRSPRAKDDIFEIAEKDKDLTTLVTALKEGGLGPRLDGKGPFTFFAPSNEAFAKIPKDELEKLLDPKNKALLNNILEYHLVYGAAVHSHELKPENHFKTLEGQELLVEARHGGVYINREAKVTSADHNATNGVMHIIDRVLAPRPSPPSPPKPTQDIIALAKSDKDLSTFVSAVTAGKLVTALEGKGPFTVFAPSNEAFERLTPEILKWLLEPEHLKELDEVLEYHVVSGSALYSKDLKDHQQIKTLEGRNVRVEERYRRGALYIYINNGHVTSRDNGATNGVVHVIDHVLIPVF